MANRHTAIIWDADVYGTPKDYNANTLEQAEALANQEATPSAKLLAFAREVEAHSQNNDLDPTLLRYLRNFEKKVIAANTAAYCMDLPEYQWRSLLKILIEVAQTHKLVLFDEQLVLLLLPDGSILPPHTARSWQGTLEELENESGFPQTLLEFHKLITTKIGGLLREHGFVLSEEVLDKYGDEYCVQYDRAIKMGKHSLSLSYQGGDGEFKLRLILRITEDNMTSILRQSDFQYSTIRGGGVLLDIPELLTRCNDFLCITDWEDFEDLVLKLRQSTMRWSDAAQDIKGIDWLLNGDVDEVVRVSVHRRIYMPYALIAARLAGNPNFEELAISLGTFGKDSGRNWGKFNYDTVSAGWPKLVKYLREELKPLV